MIFGDLPTVFVIREIKSNGDLELVGCITDPERAARFQRSGKFEADEMIINPLGGSYLAKVEREIIEIEGQ